MSEASRWPPAAPRGPADRYCATLDVDDGGGTAQLAPPEALVEVEELGSVPRRRRGWRATVGLDWDMGSRGSANQQRRRQRRRRRTLLARCLVARGGGGGGVVPLLRLRQQRLASAVSRFLVLPCAGYRSSAFQLAIVTERRRRKRMAVIPPSKMAIDDASVTAPGQGLALARGFNTICNDDHQLILLRIGP